MEAIIEKAKARFYGMIDEFGSDPYRLRPHLVEVEKWAKRMLKSHPQADKEVVLLAAWLHDLGHYPVPTEIDHAIRGEQRAKEFLEIENYSKNRMDRILHCVRSHRCRDVLPDSLEAKIIACADSASHMTEPMYLDMADADKKAGRELRVYAKMDRDYRDLGIFPEVQKELKGLYESWKKLIEFYEKIDLN